MLMRVLRNLLSGACYYWNSKKYIRFCIIITTKYLILIPNIIKFGTKLYAMDLFKDYDSAYKSRTYSTLTYCQMVVISSERILEVLWSLYDNNSQA